MIANTPKTPYIAAVFTSIRTDVEEGYNEMNELTFKELENICERIEEFLESMY